MQDSQKLKPIVSTHNQRFLHVLARRSGPPHENQPRCENSGLGVRPTPHLIAGQSSAEDQRAVSEWVSLNTDAFVAYWEGRIDTVQLGQALKQIPSAQPGSASAP